MFIQGKSQEDYEPGNYKPGKEFPEGDPTKGKPDFEERANGCATTVLPQRDHRAYLLDQAAKNEAANDEANAIQVERLRRKKKTLGLVMDPDWQRDNSTESTLATLRAGDEETADETRERIRKTREAIRNTQKERGLPVSF
jgi:hypothetical protein